MDPSEQKTLSVRAAAGRAAPLLDRMLGLTRLTEVLRSVGTGRHDFVPAVLAELGIAAAWTDRDLARIPTQGPLLALANHPHGGADGLVALDLLLRARPDARVLGNRLLGEIAGLRPSPG